MISGLSESTILEFATQRSFDRGYDYYEGGAVSSPYRRGNTVYAKVEGSDWEPYQVQIEFDDAGVVSGDCSCPYDWGGWCKHLVGVALTCLNLPDQVAVRESLEELLTGLDQAQLTEILIKAAGEVPGLADVVEREVNALHDQPVEQASWDSQTRKRRTAVDAKSYRGQAYNILHSLDRLRPSEAYWGVEGVLSSLRQIIQQANVFLENDDGRNALIIMEALTDEYVKTWFELDGSDGTTGDFFYELGGVLAESLLSAELTGQERRAWRQTLNQWEHEVADYGIDEPFDLAQLVVTTAPKTVEQLADSGDIPIALVPFALNILERRGEYELALQLAREAGSYLRTALLFVQLDQVSEAVAYAIRRFETSDDILALAKMLREREAFDEALQVGKHGLGLSGHRGKLALWLRDLASGLGRQELALSAAITAFRESPDLSAYRKVEELAGEDAWPVLRLELLGHIKELKQGYRGGPIDIYLHENLVDEAIALVDQGYVGFDLLARVVDAAIPVAPEWAINKSTQEAMSIIEPGKSDIYHHAIEWLRRARDAYKVAGREQDWHDYTNQLRTSKHGRKYKLMAMLDKIE